jgi:P-type Ca2+ transporter type 2C
LVREFDIENIYGLSEQEADERIKKVGYNELPSTKQRSVFAIAFGVVREPMFLLLIAGGTIYVLLGDVEGALAMFVAIFMVIVNTFYRKPKAERAPEPLNRGKRPFLSMERQLERIFLLILECILLYSSLRIKWVELLGD